MYEKLQNVKFKLRNPRNHLDTIKFTHIIRIDLTMFLFK